MKKESNANLVQYLHGLTNDLDQYFSVSQIELNKCRNNSLMELKPSVQRSIMLEGEASDNERFVMIYSEENATNPVEKRFKHVFTRGDGLCFFNSLGSLDYQYFRKNFHHQRTICNLIDLFFDTSPNWHRGEHSTFSTKLKNMAQKIDLNCIDTLNLQEKDLLERMHSYLNIVALKIKEEIDNGILKSNGKYVSINLSVCDSYSDDLELLYNEFMERIHTVIGEYNYLFSFENDEFLNTIMKKGEIKLSGYIKDVKDKTKEYNIHEANLGTSKHQYRMTKKTLYELLSQIENQQAAVNITTEFIRRPILVIEFIEHITVIIEFIENVREKIIPSKTGDIKTALPGDYSEMADGYIDFSRKYGKIAIYMNDDRSLLTKEEDYSEIEDIRYPYRKWIMFDGDNTNVLLLKTNQYIKYNNLTLKSKKEEEEEEEKKEKKENDDWVFVGKDEPDDDVKYHVSLDGVHANRLIPNIYIDEVRKILKTRGIRLIDKNVLLEMEKKLNLL